MATINSCNTQLTPKTDSNVLYSLQPAFLAYAANQTNITGDGTAYTVTFSGGEAFDRQAIFATPTFTAPVTGVYHLIAVVFSQQLAAGMTGCDIYINATGQQILNLAVSAAIRDVNNNWASGNAYALIKMTAGDTATIVLTISGGTKVVDISGSAYYTSFSSRLVA